MEVPRTDGIPGPGPRSRPEALPSLSIVVPVLNEAGHVGTLVERLGQLTEHPIVVVDGGSSDGTEKLLADTGRCAALARSRQGNYRVLCGPRGRAAQMNHGARHCRSDVLLFLHADTGFSSYHARAAQYAIARGADFGCFTLRIDSHDARLIAASRMISLRSRLIPSATGDQAIFMRRSLFEALGGYREIALCEDIDLIGRARRRGRFVCVEHAVSTSARRWERGGVVRTILLMWILRLGCHAGIDPEVLRRFYEDVR